MIRLSNIKLDIDNSNFLDAVSKVLKIDKEKISDIEIVRKSIDARNNDVKFIYTFDINISQDEEKIIKRNKNASYAPLRKSLEIIKGNKDLDINPVIIGSGPAGLFAALILSENGYKPMVIERGKKVEDREKDINLFFSSGRLNTDSNICFGEGGAGTFSDGKLKTRISDPRSYYVLKKMSDMGAPDSILYDAGPHVGTDILKIVISNIRKKIIENGGTFFFDSKMNDLSFRDGSINSISINGKRKDIQVAVLATGHSARDTYEMLYYKGVQMAQKPFAMGVRIEHPREVIDKALYHKYAGNKRLGAASYSLNVPIDSKKAYTFCMCPGGVVVNSASEENMLCVNGMSWYKRDMDNSNSAIVCQVTPQMMQSDEPLAGLEYQRKYEKAAFIKGGCDYKVPAIKLSDFLSESKPTAFEVMPSVLPGAVPCLFDDILPSDILQTIKHAIPKMGEKLKGFDMGGAVISAVESRTSSPIRILRGDDIQSVNVKGLYPVGEGAGYSGGIVSSAVDGIKAAQAIIAEYRPNY